MSANEQDARSFSPDGRFLLYREIAPSTGYDILMTTLVDPRNVTSLIAHRFTEENAAVSPDGKWLAYESNETGTNEVYVRPFPDINSGRWQVSLGGSHPVWARDGHELFYVAMPSQIMSVPITAATTFSAGKPTLVFAGTFLRTGGPPSYDVSPDGKRFLVIKESAPTNDSSSLQRVIVAQQWTDELQQMVQKN
jgi:serine/threonine-protein kinase